MIVICIVCCVVCWFLFVGLRNSCRLIFGNLLMLCLSAIRFVKWFCGLSVCFLV